MKSNLNWHEHQAQKKANEQARIAIARMRSPTDQLERLDMKLGKGLGAAKERAKLVAKVADAKKVGGPASDKLTKILDEVVAQAKKWRKKGAKSKKEQRSERRKAAAEKEATR